jgi:HEAT repeat protein
MTRDPLMERNPLFDSFLEKLIVEERDNSVLKEKVDFMSSVAVDRLYTQASSHIISLKGPALLALAAHKDIRCTKLIVDFIDDSNQILKSFALDAIKLLQEPLFADCLASLLDDPSSMIRIKVIETLAELSFEHLEPHLFKLAKDNIWFVREKLAKMAAGHLSAQSTLTFLSSDDNSSVRSAAQMALEEPVSA